MKTKSKWIVLCGILGIVATGAIALSFYPKIRMNTTKTNTAKKTAEKKEDLKNAQNQEAEDAAYRREIEGYLSTTKVAIQDTKISLERDELPEKERAQMQKLVSKYSAHIKEYQKRYETGDYDSLKELFEEARDAGIQIKESLNYHRER